MAKRLDKEQRAQVHRQAQTQIEAKRLLAEIWAQADEAERKLKAFLRLAWRQLEPSINFQDNWHIDCMAEHLEALANRQIRRLIINISPRSLKSALISVVFPAWRWLQSPGEKFLCASYAKALAIRDSRRCRNLIASGWYQDRWASKFALAADQNEKGRFENDKGGFRISSSVEGGVLGEGGSCLILDDCSDLSKMPSQVYEQEVRNWYSGVISSRLIDPATDIRLCVQQRAPYGQDLTAFLLELGGWDQLVIPYEYDGNKRVSVIGWSDPRSMLGELMFPARLGPEEVAQLKLEQRANWAGNYNQKPITDGTEALRRDWFNFWGQRFDAEGNQIPVRVTLSDGSVVEKAPVELPKAFEQAVQSWDMAFKDTERNDFVAGHAWGRTGSRAFLFHRIHGHMNFPETKRAVREMSATFPAPEKLVEDAANGPAVISDLANEIPGLIPVKPAGGKFARVAAISGYVEAGNVYLPNPDLHPWVWKLLDEFADVRAAAHDDDTDAMTQALARLFSGLARAGAPEFRVEPRMGEPRSACHIAVEKIRPEWRKFGAISPGKALLLMAETPTGALRVWAELDILKMDAVEIGRRLAERAWQHLSADTRFSFDILLPKEAFDPVEPIGSYAELLESGLFGWLPPNDGWESRLAAPARLKAAKFRSEMVERDDAAVDRLRSLLAFQPEGFKREDYDRITAIGIRREQGMEAYQNYMAAVEGEVRGEWPKLKISPECPRLISELGSFRTDLEPPPFVDALLLGVCASKATKSAKIQEIPASEVQRAIARIGRGQRPWMRRRA
jgi:predicted phage terminase large subunit-like protein